MKNEPSLVLSSTSHGQRHSIQTPKRRDVQYSGHNIRWVPTWSRNLPPSLAGLVILGEAGANPLIPKVFETAWRAKATKATEYLQSALHFQSAANLTPTLQFLITPKCGWVSISSSSSFYQSYFTHFTYVVEVCGSAYYHKYLRGIEKLFNCAFKFGYFNELFSIENIIDQKDKKLWYRITDKNSITALDELLPPEQTMVT